MQHWDINTKKTQRTIKHLLRSLGGKGCEKSILATFFQPPLREGCMQRSVFISSHYPAFFGAWEERRGLDMKHYSQPAKLEFLFILCRSSCPVVILEKVVLKICSKFTGEHPWHVYELWVLSIMMIMFISGFPWKVAQMISSKFIVSSWEETFHTNKFVLITGMRMLWCYNDFRSLGPIDKSSKISQW